MINDINYYIRFKTFVNRFNIFPTMRFSLTNILKFIKYSSFFVILIQTKGYAAYEQSPNTSKNL